MARLGTVAQRAEDLLGRAVVATTPVPGGDICTATRLRLSEGTSVLMKTRPHAPQDFFRVEADGLRWLAAGGGVAVPDVLAADSDCLILSWVDPSRPSPEAAEQFGRDLAVTHQAGAPVFGSESWTDGYIGTLPLRNAPADDWPDFYARRRVLPYLRLAVDRGGITDADADAVERVVGRLRDLAGPTEPPARVHGDLWSGNLVWAADGRIWLVDPAAHGGHRETDLAMLSLFGCPHLERVLASYDEVSPLSDGSRAALSLPAVHGSRGRQARATENPPGVLRHG